MKSPIGRATTPGNSVSYFKREHRRSVFIAKQRGVLRSWPKSPTHRHCRRTLTTYVRHTPRTRKRYWSCKRGHTNHADVWVLIDQRAQQVHFLVQIGSPHVAYSLASKSLCTILSANSVLLHLSAMSESHARLMAVQACPSTQTSCGS